MRIRVSDAESILDLRDHLRRAGCIAVQVAPGTLQVEVPDAPNAGQEAREVRVYLVTWTARRGVEAEIAGDDE